MMRLGFLRRLLTEWRAARLRRTIDEYYEIKRRFADLTADRHNCDPVHLYRIAEYARLMCSYEIQLSDMGVKL